MFRRLLEAFALIVVVALSLDTAPVAARTAVTGCRVLDRAGETYVLKGNITSTSGSFCFLVTAERITLDLAGHTITGPGTNHASSVAVSSRQTSTVVKNGSVTNFYFGIDFRGSKGSTVRTVNSSGNYFGMWIDSNGLVANCVVQRNDIGIFTSDGVQVKRCLIGGDGDNGNASAGLLGHNRMLVTGNTATGNGLWGINIGINSIVTNNTANDNGLKGIVVGGGSLVIGNTANNNVEEGVWVICPSIVRNNTASNNGGENFEFIEDGCLQKNNTSPDQDN